MFGVRIKMSRPCQLLRWPALLVSLQHMLHIEANIYAGEVLWAVGVVGVVVDVVGVVVVGVVVWEDGVGHLA